MPRRATNDVIQQVDLQEERGVGHPAGELPGGLAWFTTPARMVVRQDERVGRGGDRRFEDLPWVRQAFVDRPGADDHGFD